ncbi:GNAT family N-acetyltransferase [Mesorhizobium marinum]|uniref:GNAT family N-acetyltransferase n=1 Tax=Mesorhizobium marinum TaxID=3228790 RepID=UPI003F5BAEFD
MIDAAMSPGGQSANSDRPAGRPQSGRPRPTVSVLSRDSLSAYAELARRGVCAPPQSALWIEEWVATTGPDGFLAVLEAEGGPACALALEVIRSGPFRIARFMGGRHANGNFPLLVPDATASIEIEAMLPAIRAARPDIDALVLERLLPDLDGLPNPLLRFPHFPSPNLALAANLEGGFDALLSRVSGKRKRKKHRSQMRKFEAAGGFRLIEASTPEEVSRLLDAFFAMKEFRFRNMGIANVFGDVEVQNFFRSLFLDALRENPPPFVLHALEVGGTLRAVTGSARAGKRIVCEFGAIAKDELAHASPGDFLFFENIGKAGRQGFEIFDFSVGDEPYKRLWCEIETRHFDVAVPLTPKGRILAGALQMKAAAKSYVKNSPAMWRLAKMLRRSAAGNQTAQD